MNVVVYRRGLDVASGAGQLVVAQARALEDAGVRVTLACARRRVKFFLRSGRWPRVAPPGHRLYAPSDAPRRIVDHSLELPKADVLFVHNLESEAQRYVARPHVASLAAHQDRFFDELPPGAPIVANSELVRGALLRRYGLPPARVLVLHPGYRADRFGLGRALALRAAARRELGIDADTPLVGFVTSGDFVKRGLALFLRAAAEIARTEPRVRFLAVGSKSLPGGALRHPLVDARIVRHRPKSADPARWFAALDVFLYPALYEEFGMVVLEAQACGVPVITSRRVGAAECLSELHARWLLDVPDAHGFAELTLALLADRAARGRLAAAGAAHAAGYGLARHARAAARLILGDQRGDERA